MKVISIMIAFTILIFLESACGTTSISKQQIKTLDSLNGAVNTAANALRRTDTISLNKVLDHYFQYKQFINAKLQDTITKSEALDLKVFYNSGEALLNFNKNKLVVLTRLNLLNTQTEKLTKDLIDGHLNEVERNKYFNLELAEANKEIQLAFALEKEYILNFEKFTQSLKAIEDIIRRYNQNQLPTIIKTANTF